MMAAKMLSAKKKNINRSGNTEEGNKSEKLFTEENVLSVRKIIESQYADYKVIFRAFALQDYCRQHIARV